MTVTITYKVLVTGHEAPFNWIVMQERSDRTRTENVGSGSAETFDEAMEEARVHAEQKEWARVHAETQYEEELLVVEIDKDPRGEA